MKVGAKMKSFFIRIKWQYYLLTFIVATVLFIIEDVRPSHVLDSFILYGYAGHIIILVLSFIISIYLGVTNAHLKWLYPFCVAGFVNCPTDWHRTWKIGLQT